MRIGLVGVGRIGVLHAETLAGLPGVDSVVITDAVPERAKQVADRLGVEVADSAEALLAAGIEGVVVAAVTDAHPALIGAAVDAGVPVFCEKPLAGTIAESVEVVRRVEQADVTVHIGFQRRFDAGYQAARAAVRSGELGWVHTVTATTMDAAPPSPDYIAGSGGIFRDCGVHDFDIVRWVTGREVVAVQTAGGNLGDPSFAAAGDVDTAAATLTLDDGSLALVANGRYNGGGYDVRMEVHGSTASVAVGLEDRLPLRSAEPGVAFPTGAPYRTFTERFGAAYRAEIEAFVAAVGGADTPSCTAAEALRAQWVAEACAVSLAEHRAVRIEELA